MEGKSVIVTGASSGIGYRTASLFASRGSRVTACGRNEKALGALRDECSDMDGEIRIQLSDLRESTQLDRLVGDTVDAFRGIDVLVNSAGIIGNGTIETTGSEDWDRMMEINLRSVFELTSLCVPYLKEAEGAIVECFERCRSARIS